MIEFDDLMKLKVGDNVVCCRRIPKSPWYNPGERYVIVSIKGDHVELRPVYHSKNFHDDPITYDDLYQYFILPLENDFYIGDLAVLNYEGELHFVHITEIRFIEIITMNPNENKYKTGDEVWCEMCPNLYDASEIKSFGKVNFGKVNKNELVKIRSTRNPQPITIQPGMNILVGINDCKFFEHLIQIEIPNGVSKIYVTSDLSGKIYHRELEEFSIPKPAFIPGHKILSQNNTQFMVANISEFNGYANAGEQYSYTVAGLNFSGDGRMEIFEDIPEVEMNDVYGYLKQLNTCKE